MDEKNKSTIRRTESQTYEQNLSDSQQKLSRPRSHLNINRVSFRIDQKFKELTKRINVANKLSKAKRDDAIQETGALLDEPSSGSKIISKIAPILSDNRTRISDLFTDRNFKDGIINEGHLIFDMDYAILRDSAKTISRPFIYSKPNVDLKNITDILFDNWKLSVPRIVLFLLTDTDQLRTWNNSRQINSFKTGIMKAANTTSMWLVTNGLDIGATKIIGDALIEQHNEKQTCRPMIDKIHKKIPVIGITNETNLSYSQEFLQQNIVMGKPGSNIGQRQFELNSMHTNFILIQTQNSSEDSYQNLMINLIDHLTKRSSISPEIDNSNNLPNFSGILSPSSDQSTISLKKENSGKIFKVSPVSQDYSNQTFDEKTNCFGPEGDHIDETDEETSFISPQGSVIDNVQMEPILESAPKRNNNAQEKIIPVVCLVIQGDYHCAKLVLDNIRRRNPIIVLRGSGGFADLLSYAYIEMQHRCRDLYHSWDAEFVEESLKPLLVHKIVKYFPEFRNNALARNTFRDRIIECVRESGSYKGQVYLSILNMYNANCDLTNLSEFILLSLFKSQNRQNNLDSNLIRKDLYLTLDWNCPMVALDEVLSRNPSYNLQLEKSIFEIAILKADREDFVDLFLTHGFRVHKFLTPFRLIRLIRYSLLESNFFRNICMEAILGIAVWSVNFEELLEKLSTPLTPGDTGADQESFIENEFNQLIFTTTSLDNFVKVNDCYLNIMGMYPVDADSAERKALATLAMWAVFNCRFKLTEILWKHSDQPIHLGLIISMMLDRMAWFVTEQNLKDDLQDKSKIFAKLSINVLDACYRYDEQRGYDLLGQRNSDWNQQAAIDIAANGSHRAFIAHPCCQKWLTNTFNGRIRVRELSWGIFTIPPVIKIIISAFLILPMYIWIRFLDANRQLTVDKAKLLEQLNEDDEDEELMTKAAVDKYKSIQMETLKSNHIRVKSIDMGLSDNQMTITSGSGEALLHFTKKLKKQADDRQKLFIDKQPALWTMISLMWNSPITKFWTYHMFYIIYLALLSLAVIWPGCGNWYLDVTVCIWTFLNIVEHIRRMFVLYKRYTSVPMFFRIIEIILLVIFLVIYTWGRVLIVYSYHIKGHLLTHLNIDPYGMKVILCTGLLYFYYRLFYIYLPISPTLGPLLYRFKLMVSVDFIHFMRMALILLISSGIIIQALLYPNTELSLTMFHKAFHRTIVSLFTTPVDELTKNCTVTKQANLTQILQEFRLETDKSSLWNSSQELCPVEPIPMSQSCPVSGFWSYIFTFQYLICLKLILMTLLYALFASTASKLQTETDNIWKYQRYILVVDFANRPALHAPLSVFWYIYLFLAFLYRLLTCKNCRKSSNSKVGDIPDSKNSAFLVNNDNDSDRRFLSKEDYNYWRNLAKQIYDEEQSKETEKELLTKQGEIIQLICEEIEQGKNILRGLKTKINDFEKMMFQNQIDLESIKHSNICNSGNDSAGSSGNIMKRIRRSTSKFDFNTTNQFGIHYLSRMTPYTGTRIQRFPVADKFVSWDVIWINYDPVIYSRKRENFPQILKSWVDEDLLTLKQQMNAIIKRNGDSNHKLLPVFNWNAISVNPAGLTIDRRSWIKQEVAWDSLDCGIQSPKLIKDDDNYLIYKLDEEGIPQNLLGRTGLRGKGNLPRWGPNHFTMLIVSRSRIVVSNRIIEFALERRYNTLFSPMRFIGNDRMFSDLRQLFCDNEMDEWKNDEDFVSFFKKIDPNVCLAPIKSYYMDCPENTDNAWKEVKIYHVHFRSKSDQKIPEKLFKEGLAENAIDKTNQLMWINYHEDMIVKLPMEQFQFIEDALRRIEMFENT